MLKALFRLSWQMFEDETRDDPEVLLLRQTVMIATTRARIYYIQELYGTPELQGLRVKYEEFNKTSSNKTRSLLAIVHRNGVSPSVFHTISQRR